MSISYFRETTLHLGFPGGSEGKASACNVETWVQSLGWEEPSRLQSTGWQRVGHDWATSLSLSPFIQQTFPECLLCAKSVLAPWDTGIKKPESLLGRSLSRAERYLGKPSSKVNQARLRLKDGELKPKRLHREGDSWPVHWKLNNCSQGRWGR